MPKALAVLALALVALVGCSADPKPDSTPVSTAAPMPVSGAFTQWHCAGQTPVQWRYVDEHAEQVDVRIGGDDIMHRLSRRPAGIDATYSDGLLALEIRGNQGRLYRVPSGKHVDYDCKAR